MLVLLRAMLVLLLLSGVAGADIYRCRDASGSLIYTDDPSLFPAGCREVPSSSQKDVNVVPMPAPSGADARAQEAVRAGEQKQAATARQDKEWLDRARKIAADFNQARHQRYYARRRTQANINAGLQGMAQAAQAKHDLLQEMSDAGAGAGPTREVAKILQDVTAP